MTSVFVDTSAFYALVSETDDEHEPAKALYEQLKASAASLVTTSYVFLESVTLLQKRHGIADAKRFGDLASRQVELVWINAAQHRSAWDYWTHRHARGLSLVDCSCFIIMRERGIRQAFAFDAQFAEAGFEVLPRPDRVAERRRVYRTARSQRR